MKKQIKDMSADEILNMPTLGLDDSFEFRCKACGKCCKNREDILLTPYDLFRIADFFGRTPDEIVERYCEVYEGSKSHFPVVRVLPVYPNNSCPFLRNRKCVVHAKKPVLCRVYPLARVSKGEEGGISYLFNGAGCKHEPRSITVREWLGDVASEECEQAGKLWGEVIAAIHPVIQPDKLNVSADMRQQILNLIFIALWLKYDTQTPFIPQLTTNFEAIKQALSNEVIPDAFEPAT